MLLYHIVSGSSSSRLDAWTDISNQGWSSAMPPLRQVANFWRSTALSRSATKLSPDLDKITLARWQLSWLADWEVLVPLETDASDADSSRNSSGFQVKKTLNQELVISFFLCQLIIQWLSQLPDHADLHCGWLLLNLARANQLIRIASQYTLCATRL